MLRTRSRAVVAALACAAATLSLVGPAMATGPNGTDVPNNPTAFIGRDGLFYYPAPLVFEGQNGEKFLGEDYDTACGGAKRLKAKLKGLLRLAKVIDESGRRAIVTVAPTKALVVDGEADPNLLPHGECAAAGLEDERELFSKVKDPHYLRLLGPLEASTGQVFFKTDPHWTTVGGAVYSHELAKDLSPRLARRQKLKSTTLTVWGLFNYWYSNETFETAPSVEPAGPVKVTSTDKGGSSFNALPDLSFDHTWKSTPAKKTWPGHTQLIGDSFTLFALQTLEPLFAHGRFLWSGHVPEADMVQGIKDADTVVIEVVSFLLPGSPLVTPEFRRQVVKALK